MDEEHRKKIQTCYARLVQDCDIDIILPLLVQKNVFKPIMITKYMNTTEDVLTRKRSLFLDIPRRGPHAFSKLVASLRESGQNNLANLLEPNNNSSSGGNIKATSNVRKESKHTHPFIMPQNEDTEYIRTLVNKLPSVSKFNLSSKPIEIKVEAATCFFDDPTKTNVGVYSTHSKNRGYVLIINNIKYRNNIEIERRGADVDGKNLCELFSQMGFKIESHVDLTCEEMKRVISNFKSSSKMMYVDMVFVILMGHGYHESDVTYIKGVDNKSMRATWVEEQFDNVHCKALQKRPKIIMYQTCRGSQPDLGVAAYKIETDGAGYTMLRTRDDMLIAYSTMPGFVSHRDIYMGTWYISLFCELMMTFACTKHIEEIFKMVDFQLSQLTTTDRGMQTSAFINLGFKNCYIHPKIYLEDDVIKNIHDD